jgi:hypothetical protein
MYTQVAKVACGLLMCVSVGQTHRWVLDVRLQCPSLPPYPAYGAGAVVFGVVLVLGCIAWPVTLAAVLIHQAHKGRLLRLGSCASSTVRSAPSKDVDDAAGRARSASDAGVSCTADNDRESAVHTTAQLAVRYSDYGVNFEALSVGQKGQQSSGKKSLWDVIRSWECFKLAGLRLRLYAVLVWDSVLDLHRFLLALVSLCVMLHELHQLILVVMVLGSYLLLVLLVKPFRSAAVWRLQVLALVVLLTSCMGIAAFAVSDTAGIYSGGVKASYTAAIRWIVIVVNACYLLLLVVLLLRCMLRESRELRRQLHFTIFALKQKWKHSRRPH